MLQTGLVYPMREQQEVANGVDGRLQFDYSNKRICLSFRSFIH